MKNGPAAVRQPRDPARWEGSRPRDPLFAKPSVFVDRVTGIRL
jgi:hypothetical protein